MLNETSLVNFALKKGCGATGYLSWVLLHSTFANAANAVNATIAVYAVNAASQILRSSSQHSPNLLFVRILVQPVVQMVPPFEQHRRANELEPRRELELLVLEHRVQLIFADVFVILYLILVDLEIDVRFDEEDIVDCLNVSILLDRHSSYGLTLMLPPLAVTRRFIVYPRQKSKVIKRHLFSLDPQLVVQLPLRRPPHTIDRGVKLSPCLSWHTQRMRATSIRPHIRKGDLLRSSLL